MKKRNFTLLSFLLFPLLGWACNCTGPLDFCEVAQNENLTLILGKKTAQVEHGMDVEVLHVIRGNENRSKIRVWGDVGHLCRLYTSGFEIGETFIFALGKIDWNAPPDGSDWQLLEKVDDYTISVCGLYYTSCDDSVNPYTQEVEDLVSCLGYDPCNCGTAKMKIFPNPSKGPLQLTLPDIAEEVADRFVDVYNINGALLKTIKVASDEEGKQFRMDLSELNPGLYLLAYHGPLLCGKPKLEKLLLQ